jgi:hypothetical protein
MALCSLFSVLKYASDVIVVPCCMNSIISAPSLTQKTVAVSFLEGRQHLFKLRWLAFGECVLPLL